MKNYGTDISIGNLRIIDILSSRRKIEENLNNGITIDKWV